MLLDCGSVRTYQILGKPPMTFPFDTHKKTQVLLRPFLLLRSVDEDTLWNEGKGERETVGFLKKKVCLTSNHNRRLVGKVLGKVL